MMSTLFGSRRTNKVLTIQLLLILPLVLVSGVLVPEKVDGETRVEGKGTIDRFTQQSIEHENNLLPRPVVERDEGDIMRTTMSSSLDNTEFKQESLDDLFKMRDKKSLPSPVRPCRGEGVVKYDESRVVFKPNESYVTSYGTKAKSSKNPGTGTRSTGGLRGATSSQKVLDRVPSNEDTTMIETKWSRVLKKGYGKGGKGGKGYRGGKGGKGGKGNNNWQRNHHHHRPKKYKKRTGHWKKRPTGRNAPIRRPQPTVLVCKSVRDDSGEDDTPNSSPTSPPSALADDGQPADDPDGGGGDGGNDDGGGGGGGTSPPTTSSAPSELEFSPVSPTGPTEPTATEPSATEPSGGQTNAASPSGQQPSPSQPTGSEPTASSRTLSCTRESLSSVRSPSRNRSSSSRNRSTDSDSSSDSSSSSSNAFFSSSRSARVYAGRRSYSQAHYPRGRTGQYGWWQTKEHPGLETRMAHGHSSND